MNYRSLPRIANSDLSEFRAFLFGEQPATPRHAFAFGTVLHGLILEPATFTDLPPDVNLPLARRLADLARANPFLRWALRFSRKEVVYLWTDSLTGLPLKARLDLIYRNRLIVDIKSTSCRSFADFLTSCDTYDYDRQAAYYLDAVGARKFVFVAIQKVKPYSIWTVEHHADGTFIATGRKKYRRLLQEWKRYDELGQPFTPSSWHDAAVLA